MATKLLNGERVTLTQEEEDFIAAEQVARGQEEAANGWSRRREEQFDDFKQQFDDLWHAIDTGTDLKLSAFYIKRKAVKDNNAKTGGPPFVWPTLTAPTLPAVSLVRGPRGAHAEPADPDAKTPEPHPEYYETD